MAILPKGRVIDTGRLGVYGRRPASAPAPSLPDSFEDSGRYGTQWAGDKTQFVRVSGDASDGTWAVGSVTTGDYQVYSDVHEFGPGETLAVDMKARDLGAMSITSFGFGLPDGGGLPNGYWLSFDGDADDLTLRRLGSIVKTWASKRLAATYKTLQIEWLAGGDIKVSWGGTLLGTYTEASPLAGRHLAMRDWNKIQGHDDTLFDYIRKL